jgi:hypothetical protein
MKSLQPPLPWSESRNSKSRREGRVGREPTQQIQAFPASQQKAGEKVGLAERLLDLFTLRLLTGLGLCAENLH